jgi:cag pathogenicity island protein 24
MKYTRLTKEQFEEMHQEFINFLATQSITADEWHTIKINKPDVADQELDVFSDLVWEGVLNKVIYLENISPNHMYLFYFEEKKIHLIGVKIISDSINLMTQEGFSWLRENLMNDSVEIFESKKDYSNDKQLDKFTLIQQGAVITKGDLYKYFDKLVS